MKRKKTSFDLDYLRRSKKSSPEEKLQWLADAVEFAYAKKRIIKK